MGQSILLHANTVARAPKSHTLPLGFLKPGEAFTICKVKGKDETTRLLEELGFVEGSTVKLVSSLGGNLIVEVKGSRVAINSGMAG